VSVREETIDYILENNAYAVSGAVESAFTAEMDCLGTYKSYTQGVMDKLGKIPIQVQYVDLCDELETTTWQLRPVKIFK
jgi:hypothetical protein